MSDRSTIHDTSDPEYPRIGEIWEHIITGRRIRIVAPGGRSGTCWYWQDDDAFGSGPYDNFLPGPAQRFRRHDQ